MSDPMKPTSPLLVNDDGVVSKPPAAKRKPEDEPAYRWLQDPAPFCDHYAAKVYRDSNVVRMAFGEHIGGNFWPIYRAAVVMPVSDVKDLIKTLSRIVKDAETKPAEKDTPQGDG